MNIGIIRTVAIAALAVQGGRAKTDHGVMQREKTRPDTPADSTHNIIKEGLLRGNLIEKLKENKIACFTGAEFCCTRLVSDAHVPGYESPHTPIRMSSKDQGEYCNPEDLNPIDMGNHDSQNTIRDLPKKDKL